jgi:hypothetical protein
MPLPPTAPVHLPSRPCSRRRPPRRLFGPAPPPHLVAAVYADLGDMVAKGLPRLLRELLRAQVGEGVALGGVLGGGNSLLREVLRAQVGSRGGGGGSSLLRELLRAQVGVGNGGGDR